MLDYVLKPHNFLPEESHLFDVGLDDLFYDERCGLEFIVFNETVADELISGVKESILS
jgi:hypothetical protein